MVNWSGVFPAVTTKIRADVIERTKAELARRKRVA